MKDIKNKRSDELMSCVNYKKQAKINVREILQIKYTTYHLSSVHHRTDVVG